MKRHLRLTLALASGLTAASFAAQLRAASGFSIEQVLSAPFPSELSAAPVGSRVAWVFDDRGHRNIWVADGPDFKARAVTSYGADDGQEITDLTWTPDASAIVYVRGGEKNDKGEIPNPTSDARGAEQAVWVVPVAPRESSADDFPRPRRLGAGSSPAVSPRGDRVAFVLDKEMWMAPLSGASPAQRLFWARGSISSPAWSPDGNALAFVSTRGDHSLIGVFHLGRDAVTYLAPSIDPDLEPRWSPDGGQIAFERVFQVGNPGPEALTPYAVMIADVTGTTAREVWRSSSTPNGTFPRMLGGVLQWVADGRLMFASEEDGWAHLYSIAATGGTPVLLTPGACEVEHVTVTPDRRAAVYSSNCGGKMDIDRRHIWRVSVSGGTPEALTSGVALEWSPQVTAAGNSLVFLRSDVRRPAAPYMQALGAGSRAATAAARALAPETMPRDFPAGELGEPQQVIFKAADGQEVYGQLFVPLESWAGDSARRNDSRGRGQAAAGPHPAVIFVHGGPPRQMLLGWHPMYYYHNSYGLNQYLASRGYVVLSVNYRSGIGYGRAFREAPKRGAQGASEYQDVVAGAAYLKTRADVDPARIGLWGGSYGGYLTALGLARNSDIFAAGVDLHGVHDWSVFRLFGLGPTPQPDAIRIAREASPVASVDRWRSPVLFIHGDDDRNVAFSQTVDLARLLRERNVPFEQLIFPDEVHDFLRHQNWLAAYQALDRFFDAHLRERKPGTSQP